MKTIYVVYGPQGCGKTRNAELIAEKFGCDNIVDNFGSVKELYKLAEELFKVETVKYHLEIITTPESTLFLSSLITQNPRREIQGVKILYMNYELAVDGIEGLK